MIREIDYRGMLVHDLQAAGEGRADGVAPSHPNGIQIGRRRFLLLIGTIGFHGVDHARSILWQIRDGDYDGPVVREGVVAQWREEPDFTLPGAPPHWRFVREYGHPVIFGVPRGARVKGTVPAHAGLFAIKFRTQLRVWDTQRQCLLWNHHPRLLQEQSQAVWWMQARVNETEDDLRIVQPPRPLRQVGYDEGPLFCQLPAGQINQSYVLAVPRDSGCTQWMDVCHFNQGLATLEYQYDPAKELYQWTCTGPLFGTAGRWFEASLVPWKDGWVIAARPRQSNDVMHRLSGQAESHAAGWARVDDPLERVPDLREGPDIFIRAPMTAYRCADGELRLFSGDPTVSPRRKNRNPLYCWEIDPERGFAPRNRRLVLDSLEAGIGVPDNENPKVDFPKLLPHAGGQWQKLAYRVSTCALACKDADIGAPPCPLSDSGFQATGIHYSQIKYDETQEGMWEFV